MSVAKKYKSIKAFSNEMVMTTVKYKFGDDGGAVGVIDLLLVDQDILVHSAYLKSKVATTSGGAATVEVGIKGGDTDALITAKLQAALPANTGVAGASTANGLYVASGSTISAEIKVAALTAGEWDLVVIHSQF